MHVSLIMIQHCNGETCFSVQFDCLLGGSFVVVFVVVVAPAAAAAADDDDDDNVVEQVAVVFVFVVVVVVFVGLCLHTAVAKNLLVKNKKHRT